MKSLQVFWALPPALPHSTRSLTRGPFSIIVCDLLWELENHDITARCCFVIAHICTKSCVGCSLIISERPPRWWHISVLLCYLFLLYEPNYKKKICINKKWNKSCLENDHGSSKRKWHNIWGINFWFPFVFIVGWTEVWK